MYKNYFVQILRLYFSALFFLFTFCSVSSATCPLYANPTIKIKFSGDYSGVRVNESFQLSGIMQGFPGDYFRELQWQFGDGLKKSNDLTVWHAYSQPGEYVIRLYARDDCGFSDSAQLVLKVFPDNVRSSIVVNSNSIFLGRSVQLLQSGVTNASRAVVDWGDGTGLQRRTIAEGEKFFASHTYTAIGKYNIQLKLVNEASRTKQNFSVQVVDQPVEPKIEVLRLNQVTGVVRNFLKPVPLSLAVQDDASHAEVEVDWGDASPPAYLGSDFFFARRRLRILALGDEGFFVGKQKLKHLYPGPGVYTVTIRTRDIDQLTNEKSFQVNLR